MKRKVSFLNVISEQHYHLLPNELQRVTISPERGAIFQYLSQIGSRSFPEFVLDILKCVKGHTPVDITDGPGDEKQDLVTINMDGEKWLVQCKHTLKYTEHHNGDDLDLLMSACLRKNCSKALFVTNSDLTVQAKRYILDNEYSRGWRGDQAALPQISYWNGDRIWELISTNAQILNKWFSGMGQSHGLRRFSFDIVVQVMPSGDQSKTTWKKVISSFKAFSATDDKTYYSTIPGVNSFSFSLSDWFRSDIDLGLRYLGPQGDEGLVNIPLRSMTVQVEVNDSIGHYNPSEFRDMIVSFLGGRLPSLSAKKYWHIIATTPQAFIYLQDISEPKVVSVSNAESYLKVAGNAVTKEKEWVFLNDVSGLVREVDEDDTLEWIHSESGMSVMLMLQQPSHPLEAYYNSQRQLVTLNKIKNYDFFIVLNVKQEVIDKFRRLVPKSTILMQCDAHLICAIPPEIPKNARNEFFKIILGEGIDIKRLSPETRDDILSNADFTHDGATWSMTSSEPDVNIPIRLQKRIFMLRTELPVEGVTTDQILEILKYKLNYESKNGYTPFMTGTFSLASEEIRSFLFDIMSIRGRQMLDVLVGDDSVEIFLRVKCTTTSSSASCISGYIEEMIKVKERIEGLVAT